MFGGDRIFFCLPLCGNSIYFLGIASMVAMTSVDYELGLWVSAFAAEALNPLHDVLGGLVGDLAEDHVTAI